MGQGKFEKKREPKKSSSVKDNRTAKDAAINSGTTAKNSNTRAVANNGKGGSKRNRILLRIMIAVLAILLVLLVAAAVILNYVFGKINRYEDQGETETIAEDFETDPTEEGEETYETVDPDSIVWDSVDLLDDGGQEIVNILLIGQDARPGEGRARSDSMILVSLNKKTNNIQLTSFMRDLYVQIPGYQDNRINAAFRFGGPELLDQTLNVNFGVQVDGNVEVNFEAFSKIIDILGGVDVELNSEESGYMNRNGVSSSTGVNHFNGEEALIFARMRYVSDGDYGRTDRQRRVITSVINSMKKASLTDVMSLVNEVLPYVTTDLTNSEIISYVTTGLSALSDGGQLSSNRIPADDAHYTASIRGMAVLVPDLKMCQEDLKEFIYDAE